MEFYQLESFVAVVEERSFTRAARRVLRTQGAVSVAVRKLEEEVGVSLVTRDAHECTLTEAGRVMLTHARRIIAARNQMHECLDEFTTLATGRLRIAAHESAVQYLLPDVLAAFHTEHPKIKFVTPLCDVDELAQLVVERRADLGFGIRQANLTGLQSEAILTDPLVLVTAPEHPLTQREMVHLEDLSGEPFFVHHLQTSLTDTIQRLFSEHRAEFGVAAELWNFETVKRFVRAGNGVAIIPLSVARVDLASRRLVAIRVQGLEITRSIEVVYRNEGRLLPAPAAFLDLLRRYEWNRNPGSKDQVP